MFTGIIEASGLISSYSIEGTNRTFSIISSLVPELQVDQSIAHDGVCLTVETVTEHTYTVTAIDETLSKTNLFNWNGGDRVNLERSLAFNGRIDGHLVQGHIDCTAVCQQVTNQKGSWLYRFSFPETFKNLIIEKGSIAVNGISLTCFDVGVNTFSVAVIPYTYANTNIRNIFRNSLVNIEFDLIGKYVHRMNSVKNSFSDSIERMTGN